MATNPVKTFYDMDDVEVDIVAHSADKLTTARKTYVTLGTASTTTTRDWSGDTTIPVSGTLAIANGGTGQTTAQDAANALISGLPTWTNQPNDNTYLIRRDIGGTATFGQVKFSTVWDYTKEKVKSSSYTITASDIDEIWN